MAALVSHQTKFSDYKVIATTRPHLFVIPTPGGIYDQIRGAHPKFSDYERMPSLLSFRSKAKESCIDTLTQSITSITKP